MARYNYYQAGNKVICVTHYAGKSVKGVAKCNPDDTFDFEFGKKLAKARADFKVAEKRYKAAFNRRVELEKLFRELAHAISEANTTEKIFYADYIFLGSQLDIVVESVQE